jgi:RimJ/RimL family protein N-acetyltransferase
VFHLRRMTPEDKPALLDISSRIWEGTDYIPAVFDDWVRDTRGEFAAVESEGALVGCAKLTFLTDTDAWFEGMRKDPRVTEKGLADAVARYFFPRLAGRADLTSLRFSTYFDNRASIRVNERMGFKRRTVLSLKALEGGLEKLPAPRTSPSQGRAAAPHVLRDPGHVLAFLDRGGYFVATEGLVVDGWRAYPHSPGLVAERYVKPGLCRGIVTSAGCTGVAIGSLATTAGRTAVKLVCLDARDDDTADCLFDALFESVREEMSRAAARTCAIEWMIPDLARLKRWAMRWRLASWEREEDFLVYEMPLDRLRGSVISPELARSPTAT